MSAQADGFRRRGPSLALLGAVLMFASQAPGSFAQSQQPAQPQRPTFRTEANLVRVDVFATAGDAPVLDLRQEEFQVFEDGAPQKVESFEHVVVRTSGPQNERIEPNTVAESNAMAADPHNRVFVLFLDGSHVTFGGSHIVAEPLIRFIDRVLGPDDLIGLMRPEMAASEITFARKTTIIERGLRQDSLWGRRNRTGDLDPVEESYAQCYPPKPGERSTISAVAREMILRRREKMTLDAVRDTVLHLNGLREERKAVVVISEGWVLYRPGSMLLAAETPSLPQIYVGPGGKLTGTNERAMGGITKSACDADRMALAELEDETYYRDILRLAQESNVAFYPVDPRGLVAFDTEMGGLEVPLGPIADGSQLRDRLENLKTMAVATGGIAVTDSNDLDRGFKRVSDDLSSFYLLGYYTTNTKNDGTYRRITVKVTRPGVALRARRGYHAASAEELAKATAAAETLNASGGFDEAIARELGTLSSARPEAPLHLRGVLLPAARGLSLSVAGELGEAFARSAGGAALVRQGIDLRLLAIGDGGATIGSARGRIEPGRRAFQATIAIERADSRRVQVQAQMIGAADVGGARVGAEVDVPVPTGLAAGVLSTPLLSRGGPGAAGAFQTAAFRQFRRTETVRAEAAVDPSASGLGARVLDRNGQPLALPVTVTERRDETTGVRWLVAELSLAPLTTGDYVLAMEAERGSDRAQTLTAFRVVR